MKAFTTYLREKGYAENTVGSYEFAISQLIDKASPLTNQSLLSHKEWLVSSFAPKTANNRIGAINAYLGCTGARVSELRQFRLHHAIDGYMDIVSKGQKLRRVWIPATLCLETEDWKSGCNPNSLLFPGKEERAISARGIALGLKRAAIRYGVDPSVVYPHSFRHLFAKNFIERNPDISLLADLMGHESIETTRIYLRRTANEQRAAVDEAIDW